jgi:hypothetical protein
MGNAASRLRWHWLPRLSSEVEPTQTLPKSRNHCAEVLATVTGAPPAQDLVDLLLGPATMDSCYVLAQLLFVGVLFGPLQLTAPAQRCLERGPRKKA